jgi:predicted nucleic acid-binding protein
MIHLDTSVLIDALTGRRRSAPALRSALVSGERIGVSAIALFEWWCGPRLPEELEAQQALLPREAAAPFDADGAELAAVLYRTVKRPRGREIDLAIAACALRHDASLWTLNPEDFEDIPGLRLYPR